MVFTTDAADALVLHWGVSRDAPDQWMLPSERLRGTTAVSEISVERAGAREACLDADAVRDLQTLAVDLRRRRRELSGVQFVLRDAAATGGSRTRNGSSNFRASFTSDASEAR